jgi:hypothetical protein
MSKASLLEEVGHHQEHDHSKQAVHQMHKLRLVDSSHDSLLVVFFANTLGNSLGLVQLFLQLDPCIVGDVIATECIDQSFICGGLTTPCGL